MKINLKKLLFCFYLTICSTAPVMLKSMQLPRQPWILNYVTLKTTDGAHVNLDITVAFLSKTIKSSFENTPLSHTPIPIALTKSQLKQLEPYIKIIQNQYKIKPHTTIQQQLKAKMSSLSIPELIELLNNSVYLSINKLYDAALNILTTKLVNSNQLESFKHTPIALDEILYNTELSKTIICDSIPTLSACYQDTTKKGWIHYDLPPIPNTHLLRKTFFNHDKSKITQAFYNKKLRLINTINGNKLSFAGHDHEVLDCAFAHDDSILVSGSRDCTARIWDCMNGDCLHILEHGCEIFSVALNNAHSLIATGGVNGIIKIWNVQTGQLLQSFQAHLDIITSLTFNKNGTMLLASSADNTATLYSVSNFLCIQTYEGHSSPLNCSQFSPDENYILTTSDDGSARLWDAQKGICLKIFKTNGQKVKHAAFNAEGTIICLVSEKTSHENVITLWDITQESYFFKHNTSPIFALSFSDNNSIFYSTQNKLSKFIFQKKKLKSFFKSQLTAEQALLLKIWNNSLHHNHLFDIHDYPNILNIYKKSPTLIQELIRLTTKRNPLRIIRKNIQINWPLLNSFATVLGLSILEVCNQ